VPSETEWSAAVAAAAAASALVRSLDEMRFWIAVFTDLPMGTADLIHLAGR